MFPEGLGTFREAIVYLGFCQKCNAEGGKLEALLLRESFFTAIRAQLAVRSPKNRRKKREWVDPVRKLAEQGKGNLASSTFHSDGIDVPVAFDGTPIMSVRKPNGAMYPKDDGTEGFLSLEGLTIDAAILKVAPLVNQHGKKVKILADEQFMQSLMKRLAEGGMTAAEDITLEPGTGGVVKAKATVRGTVNFDHHRAMAFMLLKGLLSVGFSPRDLRQLMNLVDNNPTNGLVIHPIGRLLDTTDSMNVQEEFSHQIHWRAGRDRLVGVVLPFKSKWMTLGCGYTLHVPQSMSPPSVFPSHGKCLAIYDRAADAVVPGSGQCYTFISPLV